MTLVEFFNENPKVAIGFSGGVDSAYLLYAGKKYGADIHPYFVKTPFQPAFELEDAKRLAAMIGVELTVLEYDILSSKEVATNPINRCYYCKKILFSQLKNKALEDGYTVLIDGTNSSDDVQDRPGMKALEELSVRSPLRECGLTKSEIRTLSNVAGLFTWDKPAYACLATRIPTEEEITSEKLERIEKAEKLLFDMGYKDFRVRYFHNAARLQLKEKDISKASEEHKAIREALLPYFDVVLLDFKER